MILTFVSGGFTAFEANFPSYIVCNDYQGDFSGISVPDDNPAFALRDLEPRVVQSPAPVFSYKCAPQSACMTQSVSLPADACVSTQAPQTPSLAITSYHDMPASRINDFIFIGSARDAANSTFIKDNGIQFVLNITNDIPNYFSGQCQYQQIPILDTWNQNIQNFFEVAFQFIDLARQYDSSF